MPITPSATTRSTFGNHEPDFGVEVLRQRMTQAKFPFLAANLRDKASGQLFAQPSLIKNSVEA